MNEVIIRLLINASIFHLVIAVVVSLTMKRIIETRYKQIYTLGKSLSTFGVMYFAAAVTADMIILTNFHEVVVSRLSAIVLGHAGVFMWYYRFKKDNLD